MHTIHSTATRTGDLCSDSVQPAGSAADAAAAATAATASSAHARGHPSGASFCATKHKRRMQAPLPPTLQANSSTSTTTTATITVHLNADKATSSPPVADGAAATPNGSVTTAAALAAAANAGTAGNLAAIYGHINVADEGDRTHADDRGRDQDAIISLGGGGGDGTKAHGVSRRDRNKFCGSLPNHLDAEDVGDVASAATAAASNGGGRSICFFVVGNNIL